MKEMKALRVIALDCALTEELKWGKPCYTFHDKNIIVIQGFKEYCAVLFLKGFLLDDPEGVLVKTGQNTRVGRQMRFANVREVVKMKSTLKAFIFQAIEVERSGVKGNLEKRKDPIPEELQNKMKKMPALKAAFYSLTPGRQRAYIFHFSQPKQSKTREARVDKYIPQILEGIGLNDRF
jgi:uncharacterized protein YdeI (YjbR/CyaY-like superfamily)